MEPGIMVVTVPEQTVSSPGGHLQYLRSVPGIIRTTELVLSVLLLICTLVVVHGVAFQVGYFRSMVYVEFVTVMSIILIAVLCIINVTRLKAKIAIWPALEFIICGILFLSWLVAFLIACVEAAKYPFPQPGWNYAARIATAIFTAFITAILIVDVIVLFMACRGRPIFQAAV
ncbi:uncharacterized protein LOC106174260 [Lingula anatina]|uniref:Uncharacterized protein LOC106174260 n=1 Tax=Lingula anatina TaxID=7574 RepID=A0A1S3JLE0_LINAN|nr:uncharacterized protein LOC106174260 [Lingula anatina]XP_013411185.1 uncharacterized protein LOC106174260 [Lingula anatina]XP_013411186.1 uncharacterized protein LOC106174260 [Lingula anatina]XP_013411187.1 uncharacterized protein LOC106174260 [Lingula anatina]XP_013411188.1 uncharacterized protein LOC106174260 [Lingula anatina]|eukprot:XP_013411184.1 uncharacterized protein LOC106174260 [Lingula anatina]